MKTNISDFEISLPRQFIKLGIVIDELSALGAEELLDFLKEVLELCELEDKEYIVKHLLADVDSIRSDWVLEDEDVMTDPEEFFYLKGLFELHEGRV